jgi:hypothetical protein
MTGVERRSTRWKSCNRQAVDRPTPCFETESVGIDTSVLLIRSNGLRWRTVTKHLFDGKFTVDVAGFYAVSHTVFVETPDRVRDEYTPQMQSNSTLLLLFVFAHRIESQENEIQCD